MPPKKKKRVSPQEEQTLLLRKIVSELQKLNASLAAGPAVKIAKPSLEEDDSGDEELESFE